MTSSAAWASDAQAIVQKYAPHSSILADLCVISWSQRVPPGLFWMQRAPVCGHFIRFAATCTCLDSGESALVVQWMYCAAPAATDEIRTAGGMGTLSNIVARWWREVGALLTDSRTPSLKVEILRS